MAGRKGGGDMVLGGRHLVGIFALLVVILGVVFTLGYLLGRSQYDGRLGASVEASAKRLEKDAPEPASKPAGGDETPAPTEKLEKPDKPEKTQRSEKLEKPQKKIAARQPLAAGDAAQRHPDFDFYHAGEENNPPARLEEPPKPVVAKSKIKPTIAPETNPLVARSSEPLLTAKDPSTPVPDSPASAPLPAKPSAAAAKSNRAARAAQPLNTPQIPNGATVLQVAALVREADALALAQALQLKKFPAFVLTPGADHFYRVQVGPYADARAVAAARQGLENQGFKSIIKR